MRYLPLILLGSLLLVAYTIAGWMGAVGLSIYFVTERLQERQRLRTLQGFMEHKRLP